jgi:DNA-binding transcriptional ArsR family regulator
VTDAQARMLAAVRHLREASADELAARLGLTPNGARYQLAALVAAGAVAANGERPARYSVTSLAGLVEAQGSEPPQWRKYMRERVNGKLRTIARLQREIEALERRLAGCP